MGVSKGWKQAAGYFAGRRPAGQEDSSSSTQQPESYPNGSMSNRTFRDQGNSRNSIQYPELPYKAPDDSGHEVPVLGADTPWSDDPRMDNENRLGTINAPEMPRAGASSPKLRQQIKDMNDYLKHVGAQHERDQKALKLAHGTETEKLTTILRDRDREIALLKKNIQQTATDAGRLRTELQAAKNDVEQGRRRAAQDLENKTRTLKKDLAIAKDDNSRIEQRLKSEHSVVVASLNTEMQRVTSVASRDAENMSQQHKRAVEDIKLQHRTDLSRKDEEHERNVRKLRSEVEELNEAWLTRDEETFQAEIFSTKGILSETDGKLRERVVELQRMIDDLSSTAWKPEQEGMERVLKSMGSGQHSERALKKAFVQDVIWSTLFQWIFCSPFRMFGEEGKKLEAEWNDACGKGESYGNDLYIWPSPAIKTERWRYMTMKECREILMTRIQPSHVDQRAKVKKGFKETQDDLISALEDELEPMLALTSDQIKSITQLVKKATVAWLDFAMHRCRIVIRPTGAVATSTKEKMYQMQQGSTTLTERPNIGRYGTVKGVELDRFTPIKGCEGSSLST